ncbi:MAG: hypothetical protein GY943_28120 [Chloroflexi bacterium]|nr:hypothetical protein [Chloroflexota bacterium]
MTDDDFIIEDENDGSSRRPFLLIVAMLSLIFIAAIACSLIFLFANGSVSNTAQSDEAATIIAGNSTKEIINASIYATNTALAAPPDTPEPTEAPTNTATAVPDTPMPTETAVVEAPKDTPTPNESGTTVAESLDEEDTTEGEESSTAEPDESDSTTAASAEDGTPTPIPAVSAEDADKGALPQTGFNIWGTILTGFALLAVLFIARRLRQA